MKLSDRSKYVLNQTGSGTFLMAIVAVIGVIIYEGLRWGATWCLEQIVVQKYHELWVPFIVFCVFMVGYSIYEWIDNGDNFDRWLKRDQEEVARRRLAENRLRENAKTTEGLNLLQTGEVELAKLAADWKTRSPRNL